MGNQQSEITLKEGGWYAVKGECAFERRNDAGDTLPGKMMFLRVIAEHGGKSSYFAKTIYLPASMTVEQIAEFKALNPCQEAS